MPTPTVFTFAVGDADPLGVLSSTLPVAEGAGQVRIVPEAIAALAAEPPRTPPQALAGDALHCGFLPPRRRLNYLLVLEALNFCFWDDAPRWEVLWEGRRHDGYWALAAALRRAVVRDALPVWDAHWMAELDLAGARHLLRGEGRPVPMEEMRLANLREAGRVLLRDWAGEFANLVASAGGDAPRLAQAIAAAFPSFRDEARWRGRSVRFLKRAQICVADLARLMAGDPLGRLEGVEHLTAFADYKVPQVLRARGVLELTAALAARVDRQEELPAGSEEEVELRAATIWACEWLVRALRRAGGGDAAGITAAEVDGLLWAAGQDKAGLPPYHRTRTVFY